jgi:uncharacterized protein with von Willebrand factor type A (vWA) domain
MPLANLLDDVGDELGVVVLSDAGAARGNFDAGRNAATVAFFRALRVRRHRAMWLNPMPRALWTGSSAAQLARHVPMFPLDAPGLHRGIEVLRGRPASLERAA